MLFKSQNVNCCIIYGPISTVDGSQQMNALNENALPYPSTNSVSCPCQPVRISVPFSLDPQLLAHDLQSSSATIGKSPAFTSLLTLVAPYAWDCLPPTYTECLLLPSDATSRHTFSEMPLAFQNWLGYGSEPI